MPERPKQNTPRPRSINFQRAGFLHWTQSYIAGGPESIYFQNSTGPRLELEKRLAVFTSNRDSVSHPHDIQVYTEAFPSRRDREFVVIRNVVDLGRPFSSERSVLAELFGRTRVSYTRVSGKDLDDLNDAFMELGNGILKVGVGRDLSEGLRWPRNSENERSNARNHFYRGGYGSLEFRGYKVAGFETVLSNKLDRSDAIRKFQQLVTLLRALSAQRTQIHSAWISEVFDNHRLSPFEARLLQRRFSSELGLGGVDPSSRVKLRKMRRRSPSKRFQVRPLFFKQTMFAGCEAARLGMLEVRSGNECVTIGDVAPFLPVATCASVLKILKESLDGERFSRSVPFFEHASIGIEFLKAGRAIIRINDVWLKPRPVGEFTAGFQEVLEDYVQSHNENEQESEDQDFTVFIREALK